MLLTAAIKIFLSTSGVYIIVVQHAVNAHNELIRKLQQ
jgi:hypothetical protein